MNAPAVRPTVVIVEAYSSARHLPPLFHERGYDCVHVQSMPDMPPGDRAGFRPADFIANIVHDGDVAATAASVAAFAPTAMVAGVERAVPLADMLSEQLGLPTNGTASSLARRDKFRMIETVKRAGVPGLDQILAADLDTLLRWHGGDERRVVLKPVSSAGNDGVRFCDDVTKVCEAFEELIGTTNVLGQPNQAVLAQEYLVGSEYIVNTVSAAGNHHVCDIWKMHHLSANGVDEVPAGAELMPRHGAEQDVLVEHTRLVLDALGIRNGPAHTELKLTPEGPRLIETGARLCGADVHVPAAAAIGESQLDWTVEACVNPERFAQRWQDSYRLVKHARIINLLSPVEGVLVGYPRLAEVRALRSFLDVVVRVTPGGRISRSVDDWTFPLRVYLAHEAESTVVRDALTVRYLDGKGFYDVG
jgi:hypothetical protein